MSEKTPAPVKSSEEYFNSSRLKVIGMLTAATVVVGALGGIAGVVFDPKPVGTDHIMPVGGTRAVGLMGPVSLSPLGASGSQRHDARSPFAGRLPGSDATASPSAIDSILPSGASGSASPSEVVPPSKSGSAVPTTGPGGPGATIEATGVTVFVPPNWHVDFQDENRVFQSDDAGDFSFAFSYADDPSTAAGDVITQNLDDLLPPDSYTQRQTSDVQQLAPFGSVVSLAGIEYEALWVDNQGSVSIHGQIYVGVRQDGTVLGVLVEHVPAEEFDDAFPELAKVLDGTFNPFGGVS